MKLPNSLFLNLALSPPLFGFLSPHVFATALYPFFSGGAVRPFWFMLLVIMGGILFAQEVLINIDFIKEFARIALPFIVLAFYFKRINVHRIALFMLFLLSVDTLFRIILLPGSLFFNPLSASIYTVKSIGLPIFIDSNIVGLWAAVLFFYEGFSKKAKGLLLLILWFSFSRGAYVGFLIASIYFYALPVMKPKWRFALAISILSSLLIAWVFLTEFINADNSGRTKLMIIERSIDFLLADKQAMLIGIGSGMFKQDYTFAAHNIVGFFSELGLIGGLCLLSPILYFSIFSPHKPTVAQCLVLLVCGVGALFPAAYLAWFYLLAQHQHLNYKRNLDY